MDEARRVLARLDRIESLCREHADAGAVLAEIQALIVEAEAWTRAEQAVPDAALEAVARCRARFEDSGRTLVA